MNQVIEANFDEARSDASRMLSPSVRKKPRLWVEGTDDARLLAYFWYENKSDFKIDITSIKSAIENKMGKIILIGKKGVLTKVKSSPAHILSYGLVDMDYDFEGRELSTDSVWDTNPKVVLNSFFLNEQGIERMVKEICKWKANIEISQDHITQIHRLSKIYTHIKLFKGKYPTQQEYLGYGWKDIDFNDSSFDEFIGLLHFGDKDCAKLLRFIKKCGGSLSVCGINDHMLIRSIGLYLKTYRNIDITEKILEEGLNQLRLNEKMPSFLLNLRGKIKNLHNLKSIKNSSKK